MQESQDQIVSDTRIYQAFRKMKQDDLDAAQIILEDGIKDAKKNKNKELEGLFLSALGVLFKKRGDFKKSYKFYQSAEKLIPNDPSLKIITAKLLIFQFKQFETAIRKLSKIVDAEQNDPTTVHHALNFIGLSYLKSGKKDEAKKILHYLESTDFSLLRSCVNVNMHFLEEALRKNFEKEMCRNYLKKALDLANLHSEKIYQSTLELLLKNLNSI